MTIFHFKTMSDGWFGPTHTYIRTDDVLSWFDDLIQRHEDRAHQARLEGDDLGEQAAQEYETTAMFLMAHKADFAVAVATRFRP